MPMPEKSHGRLAGQGVIVTGAGSAGAGFGTGKAIAVLFAREGAKLALLDRDRDRAEETSRLITAAGGAAFVASGDVTNPLDCAAMVAACMAWLGRLDILVNNVGLGGGAGRLEDTAIDGWRLGVEVNFASAFYMTRAAMPHLLHGHGKSVVNIASIAGLRAHGASAYGPAKAAMIQFTRELAVMYGPDGIRANSIAPGHIMTPMVAEFSAPAARRTRRTIAPLPIEGDAWDVAQAALFLAGPEARFITGICLPVDGGVTQVAALAAHERMTANP